MKGLLLLAFFYTLYFAQTFLVPVVISLLLTLLLSPLTRRLKRHGLPQGLSAALVLIALVGLVGFAGYKLWRPAAQWAAAAPASLDTLEGKLKKLRRPMEKMSQTADQVAEIADVDPSKTPQVEIKGKGLGAVVFGGTQQLLAQALFVVFLCYFMLASGDAFLGRLIKALPTLSDKKHAVQIARAAEDQISRYLIVTTLINVVFGLLVGLSLRLLEMPNPMLWGAVAGITNFVPYIGGIACTVILALAAVLQFDDMGRAFLVPAVFTVLNLLEGNVFTPMVVGRQLSLNPLVIFLGVLFWSWIWGISGALLAVPILAALKIVCDHVERLAPLAEFLGD